jgi:hypothetical protein
MKRRRRRALDFQSATTAAAIYFLRRLKEPTTWGGIGILATVIGWNVDVSSESWKAIANGGMGIGALLAMFLPEPTQRV